MQAYNIYSSYKIIIIHITSYQKIINDVDTMSHIKYIFFRICHTSYTIKTLFGGEKKNIFANLSFSKKLIYNLNFSAYSSTSFFLMNIYAFKGKSSVLHDLVWI